MSAPFLNWTGKVERMEFQVPTLPLFIHDRLSTKAIIETLKGHKKGSEQLALFADPMHSITDQVAVVQGAPVMVERLQQGEK
ncbi:MAG: hypothetical protein V1689_02850 [Pseudomonadota bacterium]